MAQEARNRRFRYPLFFFYDKSKHGNTAKKRAKHRIGCNASKTHHTNQFIRSSSHSRPLYHPVADDLEWASAWLDQHPELLDEIATDIDGKAAPRRGRHGLTCETVLRCAVLMHLRQASYRELAFTLNDSLSARRFARLDPTRKAPGKSALQVTVGAVRTASWERINQQLLASARASGVETGEVAHCGSTAQ